MENTSNHIYRVEIEEFTLPKKLNWHKMTAEIFEREDLENNPPSVQKHTLVFQTWNEIIQKIDEMTGNLYGYREYKLYSMEEVIQHMEEEKYPYDSELRHFGFQNELTEWDKEIHFSIFKIPNNESCHQK